MLLNETSRAKFLEDKKKKMLATALKITKAFLKESGRHHQPICLRQAIPSLPLSVVPAPHINPQHFQHFHVTPFLYIFPPDLYFFKIQCSR